MTESASRVVPFTLLFFLPVLFYPFPLKLFCIIIVVLIFFLFYSWFSDTYWWNLDGKHETQNCQSCSPMKWGNNQLCLAFLSSGHMLMHRLFHFHLHPSFHLFLILLSTQHVVLKFMGWRIGWKTKCRWKQMTHKFSLLFSSVQEKSLAIPFSTLPSLPKSKLLFL